MENRAKNRLTERTTKMEQTYSYEIANAIKTFLQNDDWKFTFKEDTGTFQFGLNLKTKLKSVNYIIRVKMDDYTVYAISPISADENDSEMMQKMAEFVCRANYGLRNGNFELDVRDGELRYKSFVDCEDTVPTMSMIHNSIYCPAGMFKRYSPGILDIIFGDTTAEEAVARCEND